MFYMFYMLLSCVLTLMFREICHFNQSKGAFHLVSCQWRHTSSTKEYSAQDACVGLSGLSSEVQPLLPSERAASH